MNKWWEQPENDVHTSLVPLVKKISENQSYRQEENLKYARLYGNLDIMGLSSALYSRTSTPLADANRVTYNIIQSCIDTAAAKIAKNKPRPTFLTEGGNWGTQQKAKKLEKCVNGQFYENRTYEQTSKSFVDAAVMGTGLIKVHPDFDSMKVVNERVLPSEVLIDDAEAIYACPRNKYQVKPMSRSVLKDMFPDFKAQIDELKTIDAQDGFRSNDHADVVQVIEGWHLRSGPKAKDGRHAIVIDGATLDSGPWDRDRFPFSVYRYNPRIVGWYGQGIAEQLVGIQIQINKLLKDIQISDHLNSAPAWLVEANSQIVSAHINNEIGHIIKYKGIPPKLETWAMYHPQKAQMLENLFQKAYQLVGISEMSSQGQKPAGLDSGKALREFNDIESERFIQVGQRWEQFHMDVAELNVLESRELYKKDKSYAVKTRSKKFIQSIKWSEVDLDDDAYQMQIFPTSSLPNTPAGRMAYVQELMQAGIIDADTGMELLDFPDLEAASNLKFAARNIVRDTVDQILEEGIYLSPEPFDDLKFAKLWGQMSYNYARIHKAPEDRLELLRRFIEQASAMEKMSQGAPQDQVPPAPTSPDAAAQPEGAPAPKPTAELLPAA